MRGVEVPISPSDICEYYNIPFYEKDYIKGIGLDKIQNINLEGVIKYLTQGKGTWNFWPDTKLPINFN